MWIAVSQAATRPAADLGCLEGRVATAWKTLRNASAKLTFVEELWMLLWERGRFVREAHISTWIRRTFAHFKLD